MRIRNTAFNWCYYSNVKKYSEGCLCQGYAWEAEHWFKKAVAVKPDFRGALFNLALLLTEEQRSLEAVPYLETLLIHHPHHIKVGGGQPSL